MGDGSIWHPAVLTPYINRLFVLVVQKEKSILAFFDLATEKANKTYSGGGGFCVSARDTNTCLFSIM